MWLNELRRWMLYRRLNGLLARIADVNEELDWLEAETRRVQRAILRFEALRERAAPPTPAP